MRNTKEGSRYYFPYSPNFRLSAVLVGTDKNHKSTAKNIA